VVFPRQLFRCLNWRTLLLAPAAFALGALPLILYNGSKPLATFRTNAVWSADDLPGKARLVRYALEGSALFATWWRWVRSTAGRWSLPTSPATSPTGSHGSPGTRSIARFLGFRGRRGIISADFMAAWLEGAGARADLLLIFLVAAWLMMALNRNTGGGLHHTVLLWPMPQLFMGVAFAAALGRWTAAVGAVLVISNLLLLNNYYALLRRFGTTPTWTEPSTRYRT